MKKNILFLLFMIVFFSAQQTQSYTFKEYYENNYIRGINLVGSAYLGFIVLLGAIAKRTILKK